MLKLDNVDIKILEVVEDLTPVTLSELARVLGWSKSMVWRRVRRLSELGLLKLVKQGGTLLVLVGQARRPVRSLKLGILRASEYPYVLRFKRLLGNVYDDVRIIVYDEAFRLALDLASGKLQLGLAPVPSLLLAHRVSLGRVRIVGGGSAGGAGVVVGERGKGHATTMASTMELCAELERLELPRIYLRSGMDILRSVEIGRVRYGVLWEPYLTIAERRKLEVRRCEIPFCCVLGAHESLEDSYLRIKKLFAKAVSDTKSLGADVSAYSELLSLPKEVVEATVKHYTFLEDVPIDEVRGLWETLSKVMVPKEITMSEAFY